MDQYYVNKNAQPNGDHEVHKSGCSFMPAAQNRLALGAFVGCSFAVATARMHYPTANGCFYCANACHTS